MTYIPNPMDMHYDDLVDVVRCVQETLWPDGNRDAEWSPDTLDAIAGILTDAGLRPGKDG